MKKSISCLIALSLLSQSVIAFSQETNTAKQLPTRTENDYSFTENEAGTCIEATQKERKKQYNTAKGYMISIVFMIIPLWIKPLKREMDLEKVTKILRQAKIISDDNYSYEASEVADLSAFNAEVSQYYGQEADIKLTASILTNGNSTKDFCLPTPYPSAELKIWAIMKHKEAAKNAQSVLN